MTPSRCDPRHRPAEHPTLADRIWSDSQHNTDCLLDWTDVDPSVVSLMQLCTPWATGRPRCSTAHAIDG